MGIQRILFGWDESVGNRREMCWYNKDTRIRGAGRHCCPFNSQWIWVYIWYFFQSIDHCHPTYSSLRAYFIVVPLILFLLMTIITQFGWGGRSWTSPESILRCFWSLTAASNGLLTECWSMNQSGGEELQMGRRSDLEVLYFHYYYQRLSCWWGGDDDNLSWGRWWSFFFRCSV